MFNIFDNTHNETDDIDLDQENDDPMLAEIFTVLPDIDKEFAVNLLNDNKDKDNPVAEVLEYIFSLDYEYPKKSIIPVQAKPKASKESEQIKIIGPQLSVSTRNKPPKIIDYNDFSSPVGPHYRYQAFSYLLTSFPMYNRFIHRQIMNYYNNHLTPSWRRLWKLHCSLEDMIEKTQTIISDQSSISSSLQTSTASAATTSLEEQNRLNPATIEMPSSSSTPSTEGCPITLSVLKRNYIQIKGSNTTGEKEDVTGLFDEDIARDIAAFQDNLNIEPEEELQDASENNDEGEEESEEIRRAKRESRMQRLKKQKAEDEEKFIDELMHLKLLESMKTAKREEMKRLERERREIYEIMQSEQEEKQRAEQASKAAAKEASAPEANDADKHIQQASEVKAATAPSEAPARSTIPVPPPLPATLEKFRTQYKNNYTGGLASSSSSPATLPRFWTCPICLNEECVPSERVFCQAGHAVCKWCVKQQMKTALSRGYPTFSCMVKKDCNCAYQEAQLDKMFSVTSSTLFSRWMKSVSLVNLRMSDIPTLNCPFCVYAESYDKDAPIPDVFQCMNPECGRRSCTHCGKAEHLPVPLEEAEGNEKDERKQDDPEGHNARNELAQSPSSSSSSSSTSSSSSSLSSSSKPSQPTIYVIRMCQEYEDKQRKLAKEKAENEERDIGVKHLHFIEAAIDNALIHLCPHCKSRIMKDGGCNTIHCVCGHFSCYKCRKSMEEQYNPSTHHTVYSTKCVQYTDQAADDEEEVKQAIAHAEVEWAASHPKWVKAEEDDRMVQKLMSEYIARREVERKKQSS